MALVTCPECGHEISQAAIACPNCGRPINGLAPIRSAVPTTTNSEEGTGFPAWAAIPVAMAFIAVIFLLFFALRDDGSTADTNLNLNVSTKRTSSTDQRRSAPDSTSDVDQTPERSSTDPVTPPDPRVVTVPGSQTSVPNKGRVEIEARVINDNGTPQTVKNERFYLLDRDIETILNDAGLDPIPGQTLANSLGLSILKPDLYGRFQRDALAAIKEHIKYSGVTDGLGKLSMPNVEPDDYYLFGVTRTGRGFALWSSPVSITSGDNVLNLSPQRITEIETRSE